MNYYCRATRRTLPPPWLFSQFFYSCSLVVFLSAIVSPPPMKEAQFSKWLPAGQGIISSPASRDLYSVGLTHLSWQPSFLIFPRHGVSFRERPAISSRSHPQVLHPGRKVTCHEAPELEPLLQNEPVPSAGDPKTSKAEAMPRPGLGLQKHIVSKVQPAVLTGYYAVYGAKLNRTAKEIWTT